jgi:hypothetical protein
VNLREQPYRSLLIWSFVCLLPILPLWAIVAAPISPDCFE